MSIKVFVSHSTWPRKGQSPSEKAEQESHAQFLDTIVQGLEANPKIEVTVDKKIPTGRLWRPFLFEGMADCRAAVVLVNRRALNSDWVDTEVTIFSYRAHVERNDFRLIIVPYGSVQPSDIAQKRSWSPVATSELQMRPRDGSDPLQPNVLQTVLRDVLDTLSGLPDVEPDAAAGGWLVSRICSLLPEGDDVLKTFAGLLRISKASTLHGLVLRRRVARSMYERGPECLEDLLKIPKWKISDEDLFEMLDLLSTFWVDMTASVALVSDSDGKRANRFFALNGSKINYTPKVYLRQVCGEKKQWPLLQVILGGGEFAQVLDQLVENFHRQLSKRIPNLDRAPEKDKVAVLNKLLSQPGSIPVFATCLAPGQVGAAGGGSDLMNVIKPILARLPFLNFIVCTGTEPNQQPTLPPEFRMLTPAFSLAEEARQSGIYDAADSHI